MIKKITFLFVFLIFNLSQNLNAAVISKIIVINNDRISKATIKTYGNIKIGTDYSEKELNQILKKLYETNFFEKITLEIVGNTLNIDVIENKLVQTIIIEGIDSSKVEETILENLILKNKSPFIESEVENDLIRIKASLGFQGYYFSNVISSIIENSNNTVNLIYSIDLGDKAKISNIEFTGNKIFKDRTLRNLITTEESKFWKFISNNKYLNKAKIDLDERLLKQFFLDEGYFDVIVNSSTANLLNDNTFKLTYNIDAGDLYRINDTSLEIPIDYNRENFRNIEELLVDLKNQKYSFSKISKIVKAIDKISLSREYDFISATISEIKVNEDQINIKFTVTETEKLYIEKINIFGNNITQENVVRNLLEVDEGDPFNELLHAKSLNNIKSLNIFKSVDSELLDGSTQSSKIINITVEEKPTGEISLGAGVGTDGGTVGFSVSENNFLGKGIQLSTALRISGDSVRGNFTIDNPNFNYTGRSLNTNIESSITDKLDTNGYKTSKTGFTLGTRFEKNEDLFFSPSISTFSEKIDTNTTASAALKKQDGSYFENKFSYSLDYDLRDKRYQTSEGIRSTFMQGIPLISDDYALINGYQVTKWHKFDNNMVSDISFYGRTITSLNNKDVRVSKRLDLSSKRLRGFETGKIGPVDGSDYVGGNYAAAINLSTTLPMLLPSLESIDFKYFLDIGNVWGVDYSDAVDQSNTIRSSTGLAVDWFTPIGPMSFSLSQNLSKADTDKTETFQFNLGTTF